MQSGTSTLNGQVPPAGLSVTEAAHVLGISSNTVRARIKAGKPRAERAQRPQGDVIRVYLDVAEPPSSHTNSPPSAGTSHEVPAGISQQLAPAQQAAALARLVQEAIAPIERERDRLLQLTLEQAEQIGRLRAQLEAGSAAAVTRRPWWRIWAG